LELEAYPEPKALRPEELRLLATEKGGSQAAADFIGASEAFVRQNLPQSQSE
jgi:hypothetical protein